MFGLMVAALVTGAMVQELVLGFALESGTHCESITLRT